ncbi:AraC family transcriptional regulator [uncultured Chryseobacterium sp.]|uniref:helix-turn-helix transcriptional regulator n=1 Tax=uncultured Chryseobacterium sp. TaxID=259322 RepID=UPI0025EFBE87|nr:AraC family transcriptional regulator [uncultured Chryseobacterium sp.]
MHQDTDLTKRIKLLADPALLPDSGFYGEKFILKDELGSGYIRKIDLGPSLHLMISQYQLKKGRVLKRPKLQGPSGRSTLTFSFRNIKNFHTVMVSSGDMNLEIAIEADVWISNIIITIYSDLLDGLLGKENRMNETGILKSGDKPFVYEEISSPEILDIADALICARIQEETAHFFYTVKAQELIYLFFKLFFKRKNVSAYPINEAYLRTICKIRDAITVDFTVTPKISDLAQQFFVSESKMQRMFKQIFGTTIYSYHQDLRIMEAARLIREEKKSVSEAGYHLNFSNLSHFSRTFKKYIGKNPKKYSTLYAH